MSEKIMRAFEEQRTNPFQFKYVQLCHSLADLHSVPEPKVCIVFLIQVFSLAGWASSITSQKLFDSVSVCVYVSAC